VATLTVLAWLLAFVITLTIFSNASQAGDADKAAGGFISLAIISLIIAAAIYWDIWGTTPAPSRGGMPAIAASFFNLRFMLIGGLVADGLLGIFGLFLAGRASSGGGSGSAGSWSINAIGLLSSILGIISFYLQHLR
jgi:hypothetical protein